jgi:hypothetical protein
VAFPAAVSNGVLSRHVEARRRPPFVALGGTARGPRQRRPARKLGGVVDPPGDCSARRSASQIKHPISRCSRAAATGAHFRTRADVTAPGNTRVLARFDDGGVAAGETGGHGPRDRVIHAERRGTISR